MEQKILDKVGRYEFISEPFHCDFSSHLFMGHLGNHLLNAADFEISGCEIFHGTLAPGFYHKAVVRLRHLCHLNGQSAENPCLVSGHEVVHTEPAVIAVKIGSIE